MCFFFLPSSSIFFEQTVNLFYYREVVVDCLDHNSTKTLLLNSLFVLFGIFIFCFFLFCFVLGFFFLLLFFGFVVVVFGICCLLIALTVRLYFFIVCILSFLLFFPWQNVKVSASCCYLKVSQFLYSLNLNWLFPAL